MTSLPEDAEGIYLSELPSTVTTEYMLLYFENKKSGGNESAIIEEGLRVFTNDDGTTCGIVKINDHDVIANILSKPEHRLAGQIISVEPYIPRIHDNVSCYRTNKTDQGASRSSAEETEEPEKYQRPSAVNRSEYDEDDSQDDDNDEIKSAPTSRAERSRITLIYEGTEDRNEIGEPSKSVQGNSRRGRRKRSRKPPVPAKATHSQTTTVQESLPKKTHGMNENWRHPRNRSTNRLKREDEDVHFESGMQSQQARSKSSQFQKNPKSKKDIPSTMSTGGACIGNYVHDREAVSENSDNVKAPENRERKFAFKEVCHVKHSNLIMLRISAFPRKFSSQDVRIRLNEKGNSVHLECTSEELLKETKTRLLKDMDRVDFDSIQLPNPKCQYLERPRMKHLLEANCVKEKLYVHFEVDSDRNQLLCFGLSSRNVETGLHFFETSWHRRTIKLRTGQHDSLESDGWKSLHNDLNSNVSLVYVDDDTDLIHMECLFDESHVQNALRRVVGFLKSIATTKSKSILQLQGPKAAFFKRHIEEEMEGTVKLQRGTINVVSHRAERPCTIEVSVEGNSAIVEEVQTRVDQITLEAISFNRMTPEETSIFQIMKGLDTSNGRDFLAEFEKLHDCIVDLQKEGQFGIDRQRVYDLFEVTETEEPIHLETPSLHTRAVPSYKSDASRPTRIGVGAARRISSPQDVPLTQNNPYLPQRNEYLSTVDVAPVSFVVGRTKVEIKRGYIQKEKTDGIVNISSPNWNIQESMVSKAILKAAGPVLLQDFMLQERRRPMAPDGSKTNVIATDAHDMLQCRRLFHVRMTKGATHCRQSIKSVMKELNQLCVDDSVTTVAIPPLGVGRMYQYEPTEAASYMRDYISKYLPSVKKLTIVIYQDDEKTFNTFVRIFGQSKASPTVPSLSPSDRRNAFEDAFRGRVSHEPSFANAYAYPPPLRSRQTSQTTAMPPDLQPGDYSPFGQLRKEIERTTPIQSAGAPLRMARPLTRAVSHDNIARPSLSNIRQSDDSAVSRHPMTAQLTKQKISAAKVAAPPKYVQESPISNLKLSVCARNEETCQKARQELEKKIPLEFLYEKTIKHRIPVSKAALGKVEKIVKQRGIRAVRENGVVYLRGYRQDVERVFSDIMEVLLQESGTQETKPQPKPKPKPRRGTAEYIQSMAYDTDPEVPLHWKQFPARQPITTVLKTMRYDETGVKYKKLRLRNSDAAVQAIAMMIQQTFRPELIGHGRDARGLTGYTQLNVVSVERIENLELFNEYALQRRTLFQSLCTRELKKFPTVESLPGSSGPVELHQIDDLLGEVHPEVNEVYLFHGTRPENIQSICNKGLDSRLSGDSAMFGQGVYGAETATKADQYVDAKDNRTSGEGSIKKMFVIRMLLGDCYLCSTRNPPKFRTPPCSTCMQHDCKQHSSMFDSVLGDCRLLNREFVVYKPSQCYPEYLVSYERV